MARELVQYTSLEDALTRFGIPERNRPLVRRMVEGIGISGYYETTAYIKAVRSTGGPDPHIASGWTNGLLSEDEVVALLGDVDRWSDGERAPLWGITHPENRIGHVGGGTAANQHRDYGTCPTCFTEFSASGECLCPA